MLGAMLLTRNVLLLKKTNKLDLSVMGGALKELFCLHTTVPVLCVHWDCFQWLWTFCRTEMVPRQATLAKNLSGRSRNIFRLRAAGSWGWRSPCKWMVAEGCWGLFQDVLICPVFCLFISLSASWHLAKLHLEWGCAFSLGGCLFLHP